MTPPTWEWDDLPNRYAAKPSALTVDRGGFELWRSKGKLILKPANYGVRIVKQRGKRFGVRYDLENGIVRFSGKVPEGDALIDTFAMPDPEAGAAKALGGPLAPTEEPPPLTPPDYEIASEPLGQMLTTCLQESDNNIAENLLLITAASEGPLGDDPYAVAQERVLRFLTTEVGCDPNSVKPFDGSGLSRHNQITAKALATVLVFAKARWGETWMSMLATSGKGTLEKRLSGTTFKGKTGSLSSVSALSGYSADASGNTLVIVLVFNQTRAATSEFRTIQDEIVRKIESNRDGTVLEAYDYREGRNTHQGNRFVYRYRRH
jgi:D-alanyl-D-alanine carboxypeptidase/D-alanyl-D-alanine-endopeptidase (penicillin-binding protein 4)